MRRGRAEPGEGRHARAGWPLLALALVLLAGLALAAGSRSRLAAAPDNLLDNPSFEGTYSAYVPPGGHPDCPSGVCQTAQMAPGWTPFWRSHDPADPGYIYKMPEYKPATTAFSDPPRVRSGEKAQQYFTFFATHQAGFYQRVAVQSGAAYCFQIWGHSWSAQDDDDAYSGPEDGELYQQVGIDPWGGVDWRSPNVVWGPARIQYDAYGLFSVCGQATSDHLTVFVLSEPLWAVKHNDVYWDDASLALAPDEPASLQPASLRFLADRAQPVSETVEVTVTHDQLPGLRWLARLAPDGTLPLSLNRTEGWAGDSFEITVSSLGLRRGTYTGEVEVVLDPPLPGSPLLLPVSLTVYPELHRYRLPLVRRD
jgi:hypothetical protein